MKLFDLHCDTATEAFKAGRRLCDCTLPFNTVPYEKWTQTMAFFLHDNRREAGWQYFLDAWNYYNTDKKTSCGRFEDYGTPNADFCLLPAIENCGWICDDTARVDQLAQMGIRMMSLCWNGDTPLCGGSHGDGSGLTQQGRRVIERMQQNGLVLDVSHASDATFDDICRATDMPLVASHSNARAVCNHRRNLTDDRIREICRRGGLIGINFYTAFLHETQKDRPFERICAHLERIFELGGEKVAAIGSDFDGAPVAPELQQDLCGLYEAVRIRFGQPLADAVFYDNADAFFAPRCR